MKTPRIANAISHIDEELINNAVKTQKTAKKTVWIKWSSFAACFTISLIVAALAVPTFFGDGSTTLPVVSGDNTTTNNSEIAVPSTSDNGTTTSPTVNQDTTQPATQPATETAFSQAYFYNVSDGVFSSYVSGKVIAEDKIGNKLEDVSVTAGWKNNDYEWLTNETLRAEVYLINGILKDVAVALKFIDKGDALTTTHYYVIMNPNADLTAVQEYVISSIATNKTDNEFGEETTTNEFIGEEIVVEYTSQAS